LPVSLRARPDPGQAGEGDAIESKRRRGVEFSIYPARAAVYRLPITPARLIFWAWMRISEGPLGMLIDTDRIDDAVLALLYLGRHDEWRTWKSFDWDAMDRLHEKGLISDPVGRTKSVVFSEEGLRRSEALFWELSGRRD
jgi:hypothetical protein